MTSSFGFGNYSAASVKLEKRFSHGLQFMTSYVWSHALANSGTPLSGSSNFAPISQTNYATGYSSAAWDIRHSLTTNFNYELPFGKGKQFGANMNRFADLFVGGWQANGILTLRTGEPFTMAGANCHGVWSRCLPDYVPGYTGNGNSAPAGGRTTSQYFDTSVYQRRIRESGCRCRDRRQRRPANDDRPAHQDHGLLAVQEFQNYGAV